MTKLPISARSRPRPNGPGAAATAAGARGVGACAAASRPRARPRPRARSGSKLLLFAQLFLLGLFGLLLGSECELSLVELVQAVFFPAFAVTNKRGKFASLLGSFMVVFSQCRVSEPFGDTCR